MQPNISLSSEPMDDDPLLANVTDYQKLIGKLIYLTTTRPDIAYTVSFLNQFMHSPLKSHLKTALKVIMYLKSSTVRAGGRRTLKLERKSSNKADGSPLTTGLADSLSTGTRDSLLALRRPRQEGFRQVNIDATLLSQVLTFFRHCDSWCVHSLCEDNLCWWCFYAFELMKKLEKAKEKLSEAKEATKCGNW
uniref:Ribonuclease H-like domain-containing protein n=1 Tax=Tanacetum cinerariifolium TaxID=118510 RepID=A0A699GXG2_TANCI|nr:ribonuclease H-like domain-containing protein [Tanacetum cinerariifolium]